MQHLKMLKSIMFFTRNMNLQRASASGSWRQWSLVRKLLCHFTNTTLHHRIAVFLVFLTKLLNVFHNLRFHLLVTFSTVYISNTSYTRVASVHNQLNWSVVGNQELKKNWSITSAIILLHRTFPNLSATWLTTYIKPHCLATKCHTTMQ